jgi:hypothetical protein
VPGTMILLQIAGSGCSLKLSECSGSSHELFHLHQSAGAALMNAYHRSIIQEGIRQINRRIMLACIVMVAVLGLTLWVGIGIYLVFLRNGG